MPSRLGKTTAQCGSGRVAPIGPPRAHPTPIPRTADVTRRPAACPSHALRGTPNWDPRRALCPQRHITFVGIGTRLHVAFVGREVHPYIAFVSAEAHPHVVFVGPVDRFCRDRMWVWPARDRGFVLPLFFKTAAGGPLKR
ncbi:hypothetical protein B0H14DRAFT_3453974 [Mycena olivaceomarginata]|nr:hypothetical protein B0H14DRAFT_3453974 [Mycena olivaceomarginata]